MQRLANLGQYNLVNCMTVNRRQFLRSFVVKRGTPIRPPWAMPEPDFVNLCSRCSECIDVCPEDIIQPGSGGFPEIKFHNSGCSFCAKCVSVCSDAALSMQGDCPPWQHKAVVTEACLSLRGVACSSCGDSCDERAILFRIGPRGVCQPIIDESKCTGCGYCLTPCPVDALKIRDCTEGEAMCLS